ncbi:MAG: flippase-like domain-containing protein [bacterium]
MRIGGRNYSVKAGLTAFLAISVASALAIFLIANREGIWPSLSQLRPAYLALAASLMVAQWCLNAVRFRILVNSLGNSVSFATSLRAFMANVFMSAVTPSQTGGGPVQIYVLSRAGVPVAKGFAGCLMGAVLTVVCLVTSTVAIVILRPGFRAEFGQHLAGVLTSVVVVFSVLASLFLLSIFRIGFTKRLVGRTLLFVTRLVRAERRIAIAKRVMGGLDQYRQSLSVFAGRKKLRVLAALLVTFAGVGTNCLIALALLSGLSVRFDAQSVYLAQFVLLFVGYFVPTPGASGIAEFANYWMLSSLGVQSSVLGVYTVLWRLFTMYVGVAVGGAIVLSLVRGRQARS